MLTKHLDEAKRAAVEALRAVLAAEPEIEKAVLIDDLFGRIRVVVWAPAEASGLREKLDGALRAAAGPFWSGDVWMAGGKTLSPADAMVYEKAWAESGPITPGEKRLHVGERRRNRSAWFRKIEPTLWPAKGDNAGPPVLTFFSFKGGVGRTTALAAFAIQRAREGERVAVIDMDLDAPGAGTLLAADDQGTVAPWGAIDYLLERPLDELDLRDYYHACRREPVTGKGEIVVVPAGSLAPTRDYLNKLARVDFESPEVEGAKPPLYLLLEQVRQELRPHWILLDSRAGLSEPAGLLLGGIAHLQILFGTSSEQSWQGLQVVLERIGASRVREGNTQLECILVQAMVPENAKAAAQAKEAFAARALEEYRAHYYAEDPEDPDEDALWYVRDSEASDSPHVPVPITYQPKLAHFERLDEVADDLANSPEHKALAERIQQRFVSTKE